MLAVGAYLQTLRKAHGFSRAEVAHQVGTHESQIVRIESGEQDSRGSLLFALIRALKGSPEDVDFLILDKRATKENAESLAKQRLSVQAQEDALIEAADTDEKRAELLRRIAEMTTDPILRARIEGYLDGLSAS